MSQQLSDVVTVMDMDGFTVNKRFYCRKLGLLKVGDSSAQSFFFDLGLRWNDVPWGTKAFKISALEAIVADLYHQIKVDTNSTVAYKGRTLSKRFACESEHSVHEFCVLWLSQGWKSPQSVGLAGNLCETPNERRALALLQVWYDWFKA